MAQLVRKDRRVPLVRTETTARLELRVPLVPLVRKVRRVMLDRKVRSV
jgi:hypothetical protein